MRKDRFSEKIVRRLGKTDAPECNMAWLWLCDFHAGEEATEEARSEFNRGLSRE